MLRIASSNCSPRVSGTNVTSLPNNSPRRFATGAKDFPSLSSSVLHVQGERKGLLFRLVLKRS